MREYTFENVVGFKTSVEKEFYMWSDYGVLVLHYLIDCVDENGRVVRHDISELNKSEYFETPSFNLEYASQEAINAYKEKWSKVVLEKASAYTLRQLIGLEWEIVRGRKYPVGTRFINKYYYQYDIKGTYGHSWVDYLCDNQDWRQRAIKVNLDNCKVVGFGSLTNDDIYNFDYIVSVDDLN